jgi:hypothetical protein
MLSELPEGGDICGRNWGQDCRANLAVPFGGTLAWP